MFSNYSDGYCLQCALKNEEVEMLLNIWDHWECPVCHLQAEGSRGRFMILLDRGEGNFKSQRVSATEYIIGALVTRQSADDPYESDGSFKDEADFRSFLEIT